MAENLNQTMNNLSHTLLRAAPFVLALGLSGDAPLNSVKGKIYDPTAEGMAMEQPEPEPESEAPQPTTPLSEPVKSAIKAVLQNLGTDLCAAQEAGKVKVEPFGLDLSELNEALHPNSLDGASWGLKKNISPNDVATAMRLFYSDKNPGLPFCYSEDGLIEAFWKLDVPKDVRKKVSKCIEENNPYSAGSEFFHTLEDALNNAGMRVPLNICISHYGGDYGPTKATISDDKTTLIPSCFTTIAASTFGYPPNAKEPYAAYLAHQEKAVKAVRSCIQPFIEN